MARRYVIADVFTDRAFGGNPLAVFLDAEGLDPRQMQAIAREMNLSETTFVTPGSAPGRFRVRIFTPAHELPFAGHPTVGTAVVLHETGLLRQAHPGLAHPRQEGAGEEPSAVVLEEGIGPVRVSLRDGGATFFVDGAPERREAGAPVAAIADALGVAAADLAGAPWQAGYGGVAYLYVPLKDRATVARSWLKAERFAGLGLWAHGVYPFAYEGGEGTGEARRSLHARSFVPGAGVAEDPATGSAAAALAGSIETAAPDGPRRLVIAQGVEMGRPSRIETEATWAGGAVARVSVGGGAVLVADARLLRDP